MDPRLKVICQADTWEYAGGVEEGFRFAIQRLRENKFYGHYAENLADWLEKHLTEEVTTDLGK